MIRFILNDSLVETEAPPGTTALGGDICLCTGHIPFRRVVYVPSGQFKDAVGPGDEKLAHAPNEACPVDHLVGASAFYAAFAAHLNGKS